MNKRIKPKGTAERGHSVLFLKTVPTDTKDLFKAYCARRGMSMTHAVTLYMQTCAKQEMELMNGDRAVAAGPES